MANGGVKGEWVTRRAPVGGRQTKMESVYYQAVLAEADRREMAIEKSRRKPEWNVIQGTVRHLQEAIKWMGMAEATRRPEIWKYWSLFRRLQLMGSGLAIDEKVSVKCVVEGPVRNG